jgi:hypothetical protein
MPAVYVSERPAGELTANRSNPADHVGIAFTHLQMFMYLQRAKTHRALIPSE